MFFGLLNRFCAGASTSGMCVPDPRVNHRGWLQKARRARRSVRGRLQLIEELEIAGDHSNERMLVRNGSLQDGERLVMVA
jgi:hypothetical protein